MIRVVVDRGVARKRLRAVEESLVGEIVVAQS